MSRKAKSEHERVHFTLGNDERVMKSSYQLDFDGIRVFHVPRSPKATPPIPAPLAVHDDPSLRLDNKWFSSTQKDFIGFTPSARKCAYESSRNGFRAAKKRTREVAVMRTISGVPSFSKYSLDFRPAYCLSNNVPAAMKYLQEALKAPSQLESGMMSEARDAFRWPSADRIKLPLHLGNSISGRRSS
ncbi:uncharacterized protein LOC127882200 [Dreissena polymorpha]|uniref:Uncharacterized protein n=1 Tax=Dreissena polymorpha TaxID=45954 RepID=A0A9D4GY23_DREPO|nr:uncharacterized protein LOC127882200 [Dreissena polymorpha]KAH3825796.1 hypothetical protein DPMN_127678 [Dreissena polymorpha]